jgi:tetrahydromethanopterin S-methyltransferase subunit H
MVRSVQRPGDYALNHQPKIFCSRLSRCCIVGYSDSVIYNSLENTISHSNIEMMLNKIQGNTGKFQQSGVLFFFTCELCSEMRLC